MGLGLIKKGVIAAARRWLLWVALAGLLGSMSGCERPPPEPTEPASRPAATRPAVGDLATIQRMVTEFGTGLGSALPAGHPPVPATLPATLAGRPTKQLQYDVPAGWRQVKPTSAMRVAQYEIAPAAGDAVPGEVAVFHFAGAGGSVEDNMERWIGQFVTADGRPIERSSVRRDTFEVGPFRVHFVELSGHMVISQTLGGSGRPTATEYRLLGAIVETPEGNWFFKGTGPSATMASAREDMLDMLRSIRR